MREIHSAGRLVCLAFIIASAAPVHAAFEPFTILDPDDASLDTQTNLAWLHPHVTVQISLDDLCGAAAPNNRWLEMGLRHATTSEVCDLFSALGAAPPSCPGKLGPISGNSISLHIATLGATATSPSTNELAAMYGASCGTTERLGIAIASHSTGPDESHVLVRDDYVPRRIPADGVGHFLVMDVPEPGAQWLLASGGLLLAALQRRRLARRSGTSHGGCRRGAATPPLVVLLLVVHGNPAHAYLPLETEPQTLNSPSIAVPERVAVNRANGTLAYVYPIELPPGTGGLTPSLGLSYSSTTKGTEYGWGWTLNLPYIERSTRFGKPSYSDPESLQATGVDEYELRGSTLAQDPSEPSRFFLEHHDGSRIRYHSTNDSWERVEPDGTRFLYGSRPAAASTLSDGPVGAPGAQVFRWRLDAVSDARGNRYEIDYEPELYAIQGVANFVSNNHPRQIRYSYHPDQSPEQTRRLVEFRWEDRGDLPTTTDYPTSYRAGFKIQKTLRLKEIRIGIEDTTPNGVVETSEQIRRYVFSYFPKTSTLEPLQSPFSKLESIQRYGIDDEVFPSATHFSYHDRARAFVTDYATDYGVTGQGYLDWENSDDYFDIIEPHATSNQTGQYTQTQTTHDMNGDGLMDLLTVDPAGGWLIRYGVVSSDGLVRGFGDTTSHWLWSCQGSVSPHCGDPGVDSLSLNRREWWVKNSSNYPVERTTASIVDLDGDGLPDYVLSLGVAPGDDWVFYRNQGDGTFAAGVSWNSPNHTVDDPPAFNNGWGGLNNAEVSNWSPAVGGIKAGESATLATLADVNGDGRPDHVAGGSLDLTDNPHHIRVALNTGSGFAPPISHSIGNMHDTVWAAAFATPSNYNLLSYSRITLGVRNTFKTLLDINGDGLPDHVYRSREKRGCSYREIGFNLGDGWQYPTGSGHQFHPVTDPENVECSGWLWSDAVEGGWGQTGAGIATYVLMDINGDEIVDKVEWTQGSGYEVRFGLGDGSYAEPIEWQAPLLKYGINEAYIRISHSLEMVFQKVPFSSRWLLVTHRDLNGDGLADFIISEPTRGAIPIHDQLWAVMLHPGPPGLLAEVENELGGMTNIEYESSTIIARKAAIAAPEALGQSIRLDGNPRWLVSRVTHSDGRAATPDEEGVYEYAEPRYDWRRRERLGMRMTESTNALGDVVREVFHQRRALEGLLQSFELRAPTLLRSEEVTWSDWSAENDARPGVGIANSWLNLPLKTVTRLYDPDNTSLFQEHTIERRFDPIFANLTDEHDWGPDNISDEIDPASVDDLHVRTDYAINSVDWLTLYPQRSWTESEGEPRGMHRRYFWDTGTSGAAPHRGLLTGLETERTHPDSSSTTTGREIWSFDPFGNPMAYTSARQNHDDPGGTPSIRTTFDATFNTFVVSRTNALDITSRYQIEPMYGNVEKVRHANGYLKCWSYDAFGRLQKVLDHTAASSDISDQCTQEIARFGFSNLGSAETQRIEHQKSLVPHLDIGLSSFQSFDGFGRIYREIDQQKWSTPASYRVIQRGWDARGNHSCQSLPYLVADPDDAETMLGCQDLPATTAARRITQYDGLERPLTIELQGSSGTILEGENRYTIAEHDGLPGEEFVETRITHGDPEKVIQRGLDPLGQVVSFNYPGESTTTLLRDGRRRLVAIDGPDVALAGGGSDPNRVEIADDSEGRRVRYTQIGGAGQSGKDWKWDYDRDGGLVLAVRPNDPWSEVRYHHDVLGRLIVADRMPHDPEDDLGMEDTSYLYDVGPLGSAPGRITRIITPGYETSTGFLSGSLEVDFGFNLRGEIISKRRTYDVTAPPALDDPGAGQGDSYFFAYEYDPLGRRVETFYPDLTSLRYGYDGVGIASIVEGWSQTTLMDNFDFHANGMASALRFPVSGVSSSWSFDPDTHRPARTRTWSALEDLQDLNFVFDEAGNVGEIRDDIPSSAFTQSFGYDDHHRLTSATADQGPFGYGVHGYQYDSAGNLRVKGPITSPRSLGYGAAGAGPHAVTSVAAAGWSVGYSYNDWGDATSRSGTGAVPAAASEWTLDWSPDGRLRQEYRDADNWSAYQYDHRGRRLGKLPFQAGSFGFEYRYVDREYELRVGDGSAPIKHVFAAGRRRLSLKGTRFGLLEDHVNLHPDHLGSNHLSTDEAAQPERSVFSPFGQILASVDAKSDPVANVDRATRYLFTGQEDDVETGLQYFGSRYYDPFVGRFMSQDPELVGHEAGVTFDRISSDAQNLNAYSYVLNRPTAMTDADGGFYLLVPVFAGLVGAGAGAVGNAVSQVSSNLAAGDSAFANFSFGELAVSTGVGFVAGAAAPVVATSLAGTASLSATANIAQTTITAALTGRAPTRGEFLASALTGAIGGAAGGKIAKTSRGILFDESSPYMSSSLARAINENGEFASSVSASNLARNILNGTASNLPVPEQNPGEQPFPYPHPDTFPFPDNGMSPQPPWLFQISESPASKPDEGLR